MRISDLVVIAIILTVLGLLVYLGISIEGPEKQLELCDKYNIPAVDCHKIMRY